MTSICSGRATSAPTLNKHPKLCNTTTPPSPACLLLYSCNPPPKRLSKTKHTSPRFSSLSLSLSLSPSPTLVFVFLTRGHWLGLSSTSRLRNNKKEPIKAPPLSCRVPVFSSLPPPPPLLQACSDDLRIEREARSLQIKYPTLSLLFLFCSCFGRKHTHCSMLFDSAPILQSLSQLLFGSQSCGEQCKSSGNSFQQNRGRGGSGVRERGEHGPACLSLLPPPPPLLFCPPVL